MAAEKHTADVTPKNPPPEAIDRVNDVDLDVSWSTRNHKRSSDVNISILMVTGPHFAEMARSLSHGYIRNWSDFYRAAGQIWGLAGISEDSWNASQKVFGPQIAVATIALVFDKYSTGEVSSPGGYLRGMVQKVQAGELHLDRSFYGRLSG